MARRRLPGAEAAARLAAATVVSPHGPRREWNVEPPAGPHLEHVVLFCPVCQFRGVASELGQVSLTAGMYVGLVASEAARPGDWELVCQVCQDHHRARILWPKAPPGAALADDCNN